jgi:hypothetical protein
MYAIGRNTTMRKRRDKMQESVKKLAELKMKLVTATDFHPVFTFFFDHFGENMAFLRAGVPQHNDQLQQVLVACAQPVLQQSVISVSQAMMIYVAPQRFYHGGAWFNQMVANFFYFEDIDAGLLALAEPSAASETMIIRFSLQMLDEPLRPSAN